MCLTPVDLHWKVRHGQRAASTVPTGTSDTHYALPDATGKRGRAALVDDGPVAKKARVGDVVQVEVNEDSNEVSEETRRRGTLELSGRTRVSPLRRSNATYPRLKTRHSL